MVLLMFVIADANAGCGGESAATSSIATSEQPAKIPVQRQNQLEESNVVELVVNFAVEQLDPEHAYLLSLALTCPAKCNGADTVELGEFAVFPLAEAGERRDLKILLDAQELGDGPTQAIVQLHSTEAGGDVGSTRIRLNSAELRKFDD